MRINYDPQADALYIKFQEGVRPDQEGGRRDHG